MRNIHFEGLGYADAHLITDAFKLNRYDFKGDLVSQLKMTMADLSDSNMIVFRFKSDLTYSHQGVTYHKISGFQNREKIWFTGSCTKSDEFLLSPSAHANLVNLNQAKFSTLYSDLLHKLKKEYRELYLETIQEDIEHLNVRLQSLNTVVQQLNKIVNI